MSREEMLKELKPLLDSLYGENEYGFFMETPQEEGLYEIKYELLFGVTSARCDTGRYGGGDNTPEIVLKTCMPVEERLERWGSFFCLLIQKEIQVCVSVTMEVYGLHVQASGLTGGLAGLLRRVGISDYQESFPIKVCDESIWVDELTNVGR